MVLASDMVVKLTAMVSSAKLFWLSPKCGGRDEMESVDIHAEIHHMETESSSSNCASLCFFFLLPLSFAFSCLSCLKIGWVFFHMPKFHRNRNRQNLCVLVNVPQT